MKRFVDLAFELMTMRSGFGTVIRPHDRYSLGRSTHAIGRTTGEH